ncbi:hypothetical protein GCM10012287_53910 [Streptomyces daqingensis]|uniref:Integral membrane protein n=1 Tax=Streptomyces daqingensis TaxID=1472640 RepID=A0ABQ2MSB5_9ACTN|nr:hypothetical protein [Streptomyces daqingensis]GGO57616.1 hypothetical protein GCM10012287_53910 [Streptomyces daqingensis]
MRTDLNAAPRGRRLSRRTATALTLLGLLAAGYLGQLLGLVLASAALVVAGAALGVATEAWLLGRWRTLARGLGRAQLYHPVRQLLRDALLLAGLARLDVLGPSPQATLLLVAVLGCWAGHFVCQAAAARVRHSRRLPIVTRNIDASSLRLGTAPPAIFGRHGALRLLSCSVLVTAGLAATAVTGSAAWGAGAALGCWAVLACGVALLVVRLLPGRRPAGEEEALAWLDGWLDAYRPTVGMYFSGGASSAYQANMWLSTLEQLGGRPIIVLRERFMVQQIDVTDVPIVCVPKVAHLMRLERSSLPVMLHPANSGKTSQVLRIPTIKHAFINHGESDKLSSCNPYAKAYDEVWVAGPAARERYQLADIGVLDADVVEVGRPQLAPIRPYAGPPAPGTRTTVLYAPTWEGWTDDPGNTSLPLAGERIVRALLDDPGVRLLYKPHPMTGSVDQAAGEADRRIRVMIEEAVRRNPAGRARSAEVDATAAELERCTAELRSLAGTGARRSEDEAERMGRQRAPVDPPAARVLEAVEAWEECFWRAHAPDEHLVLAGPRPGVYACFNQADVLVSDVSSVVSDYLTSGKPYAVVNTTGLPEESFRTAFPTVRAATVLTPAADGLPALLEAARNPEADTMREARAELRAHLLGPDDPPALTRFSRAVEELRASAAASRARRDARQRAAAEGLADGVTESVGDGVAQGLAGGAAEPSAVAAAVEERFGGGQFEVAGSGPLPRPEAAPPSSGAAGQLPADASGDEEAL